MSGDLQIAGHGYWIVFKEEKIVQFSENIIPLSGSLMGLSLKEIVVDQDWEVFRQEIMHIPTEEYEEPHLFKLTFSFKQETRFVVASHYHGDYLAFELELDRPDPLLRYSQFSVNGPDGTHYLKNVFELDSLCRSSSNIILQFFDAVDSLFSGMNDLQYLVYFTLKFLRGLTNTEGSLFCQYDEKFNARVLGEDSIVDFSLYKAFTFNADLTGKLN